MSAERRKPVETASNRGQPGDREEPRKQAKPFEIDKWEVWEAFRLVKANRGGCGVDGQSIKEFESDLKGNLYKLWNRMSSGSYFPPPVRRVEIPKAAGGTRPLGIPTVADRVAQMVVKRRIEPLLEPVFHNNSFGYRPGKSALDAISTARLRCLERAWVLDIDIKGFFDSIDHALLLKALRKHVKCRWVLLYIERWLKAPVQMPDGAVQARDSGTPQGGVISPLLANLFLHYAFDMWVVRCARNIRFERYADDIVCHCESLPQAQVFHAALQRRMTECKLQLHPEKTQIIYCRDSKRTELYERVSFDFLGYRFKPRRVKQADGRIATGFMPAISSRSASKIWQTMRDWNFHRRGNLTVKDLSVYWNPKLRGWMAYYGVYHRSRLQAVLYRFDLRLAKWMAAKHERRQSGSLSKGWVRLQRLRARCPHFFAHWQWDLSMKKGCVEARAV
jgi:RNA-directed DNA polymerase